MSSFASMLLGEVQKAKDKAEKSILQEMERVKLKAEKYFNLEGGGKEPRRTKKEESKERTRQLITDDVYLYTTKIIEPLSFLFEIGSDSKTIRVTLNFTGSQNFITLDENNNRINEMMLSSVIYPYNRKIIGSMIEERSSEHSGRLAMDYSWEFVETDRQIVKASVNENQIRVFELLEKQKSMPDVEHENFIDVTFPPCR